jgi:hypothetical protein
VYKDDVTGNGRSTTAILLICVLIGVALNAAACVKAATPQSNSSAVALASEAIIREHVLARVMTTRRDLLRDSIRSSGCSIMRTLQIDSIQTPELRALLVAAKEPVKLQNCPRAIGGRGQSPYVALDSITLKVDTVETTVTAVVHSTVYAAGGMYREQYTLIGRKPPLPILWYVENIRISGFIIS